MRLHPCTEDVFLGISYSLTEEQRRPNRSKVASRRKHNADLLVYRIPSAQALSDYHPSNLVMHNARDFMTILPSSFVPCP